MSRGENKIVMGYFELPVEHYEAVFSLVKPVSGGKLLDPFAGEGNVAVAAAEAWGMSFWLNELDKNKAQVMIEKYGHANVVQGDVAHLHTRNNAFSIVWNNPPYDHDATAGDTTDAKRVEYQMLREAWRWVQPSGLMMWVVYSHHVTERAAMYLACNSSSVDIWALPGKHLDWNQVIVVARKNDFTLKPEAAEPLFRNILAQRENPRHLLVQAEPVYTLPRPANDKGFYFASNNPDPTTISNILNESGAWQSNVFQDLISVPQQAVISRPIHQARPGHAALVLAGGGMNGEVIEAAGYGHSAISAQIQSFEEIVDFEVEENPNNPEEVTKTTTIAMKPRTRISLLTDAGKIVEMVGDDSILSFIVENRHALSERIANRFDPLYKFDFNGEDFKGWLDKLRLNGKHKFFTSQKHVISAVVKAFQSIDGILLVGQMGSGKTSMGSTSMIAIAEASANAMILAAVEQQSVATDMRPDQIALVVAPPHLSHKWEREAQSLSKKAYIRIVKRYQDVNKFMAEAELRPDQPKVMIVKRSLLALGSPAVSGARWVRRSRALWPEYMPVPDGMKSEDRIQTEWIPTEPVTGEIILNRDKEYASDEWIRKQHYFAGLNPAWQFARTSSESSPLQQADKKARGRNSTLRTLGELLAERISAERVAAGLKPLRTNYVMPLPDVVSRYFDKAEYVPAKAPSTRLDEHIVRHFRDKIYLLAWDEVHEAQNSDSGRGEGFARLAGIARKKLALTGTPVNGKASSMFNLLYGLIPQTRELYPWGGSVRYTAKDRITDVPQTPVEGTGSTKGQSESRWVRDMGVRERIVEEKPDYDKETGAVTGTKTYKRPYEEANGVSPLLISYILSNAIFISLRDMGKKSLPDYQEIAVPVEMDSDVQSEHDRTTETLKRYMLERRWEGDNTFMGVYLQWAMGWHNQPYNPREIIHKIKDKVTKRKTPYIVRKIASMGEERMYAKEQVLREYVEESLSLNRPVIVYIAQSDTRDIRPRIKALLETIEGAKTYILDKSISTDRREAVIEAQVQQGCNVLITHPGLVETGLDLLHFPDIYVYEPVLRLATMMQATARAYRLNQTHKYCRVFFLYHVGTMEEHAIELMSKKQRAAKLLTGDLGLTGLDALTERENSFERQLLDTIASDVAQHNASMFKSSDGMAEIDAADANFWLIGDDQNQDEDEEEVAEIREMNPVQQGMFDALPRHENFVVEEVAAKAAIQPEDDNGLELLPKWLTDQMPATNSDRTAEGEQIVYAKLFTPDADWTLFISAFNPATEDMLCYAILNGDLEMAEWGVQYLWYLKTVKGGMGLPMERDTSFEPKSISQAIAEWKRGQGWADEPTHTVKQTEDGKFVTGDIVAVPQIIDGVTHADLPFLRGEIVNIYDGVIAVVLPDEFCEVYPENHVEHWSVFISAREAYIGLGNLADDLIEMAEAEFAEEEAAPTVYTAAEIFPMTDDLDVDVRSAGTAKYMNIFHKNGDHFGIISNEECNKLILMMRDRNASRVNAEPVSSAPAKRKAVRHGKPTFQLKSVALQSLGKVG
jgi:hypothetical protein